MGELVKNLTHYFPNVSGLVHIINNSPANALLFEEKFFYMARIIILKPLVRPSTKSPLIVFQVNIHTGELLFPIITNYADLQPGIAF